MKPILSEKQAIKELAEVHSCATGTDRFIAQTIPLLIRQNDKIITLLEKVASKPKKRKLSEYQKHCQYILSRGYTMRAAAESWNNKKRAEI